MIPLHDLLDLPTDGTVQTRTRDAVIVPTTLPLLEVLAQVVAAGPCAAT